MNKLFESLAKKCNWGFLLCKLQFMFSWVTRCICSYDTAVVALCLKTLLSLLWLLNHPILCEWEMLDLTPMMGWINLNISDKINLEFVYDSYKIKLVFYLNHNHIRCSLSNNSRKLIWIKLHLLYYINTIWVSDSMYNNNHKNQSNIKREWVKREKGSSLLLRELRGFSKYVIVLRSSMT